MSDRSSCKFCERSSCRNGSECKQRKSQPFFKSGPGLAPRLQVCAHYAGGNCAYGDKCIKQHTAEPSGKAAPPLASANSSASESKKPNATGAREARRPAKGARTKRSNVVKERDNAGGAKVAAAAAEADAEQESGHDAPLVAAPSSKSPSKSPCIFFLTGTCKSGDACDFAHENPTAEQGRDHAAGIYTRLF